MTQPAVLVRAWGLVAGVWTGPGARRTERRIRAASVAVAALSQLVLWAAYGIATDWCFCAVTGSTGAPTPAWVYPTVRVTAAPGLWLPAIFPVPNLWLTLINLAAWTVAAYVVLKVASVLAFAARAGLRGLAGRFPAT